MPQVPDSYEPLLILGISVITLICFIKSKNVFLSITIILVGCISYQNKNTVYFSLEKIYKKVYEQFIGIPQGRYSVVAETLNVRIKPDISGEVLTSLNKTDEVFVYESNKNWARISDFFDGASYGEKKPIAQWVSSGYLNLIEKITHKQLTNRIKEKIAKKNEQERQKRINQRCSRALFFVGQLGRRKAASRVSEILNELDGCNGALGVSKSKLVKLSREKIRRCNKEAINWQYGSKTAAYKIRQLGGCNGLLSHLQGKRKQTVSNTKKPKQFKLNRPYLTGQKGIVGGQICYYSDGSATRVSGMMCPNRN